MAEFLIYDKSHWLDKVVHIQLPGPKARSRYQHGDIIEIRPDGFWTGLNKRGFNQKAFRVASVPGFRPPNRYLQPLTDAAGRLLVMRKFFLDIAGDAKIVTLTVQEFNSALKEKS